ncbi:MAG: 50S ribosomal protein L1 [Pseudomonadota bacterium]
MAANGKRYRDSAKPLKRDQKYKVQEALALLSQFKKGKFDETVELSIRLGVDPKHADQMVRGSTQLPHGTGKTLRVAVVAKGEKDAEAKEAGADVVGAEDLVAKIQGGWLEFDKLVATPDVMNMVGKLGQILGPRGLMPNPKTGTVTFEVGKVIKALKAGKVDFKVDKSGIVHTLIGKASFGPEKLAQNLSSLMESVVKAKPATAKGAYIRSITVSTTMGPGIKIDPSEFLRV